MKKHREQPEEDDRSFLDIDLHRLEEEWIDQPKRYDQWARRVADARLEYDQSVIDLKVTQAEVEGEIRDDPGQFGLEKVTEAAVAAAILQQDAFKEASTRMLKLKHRVGVLEGTLEALQQRRRALEKIVDLHGQQYFSIPRARGEAREGMENVSKRDVRNKAPRTGRNK